MQARDIKKQRIMDGRDSSGLGTLSCYNTHGELSEKRSEIFSQLKYTVSVSGVPFLGKMTMLSE